MVLEVFESRFEVVFPCNELLDLVCFILLGEVQPSQERLLCSINLLLGLRVKVELELCQVVHVDLCAGLMFLQKLQKLHLLNAGLVDLPDLPKSLFEC